MKLSFCEKAQDTVSSNTQVYSPERDVSTFYPESVHANAIDESALWAMVREQEEELQSSNLHTDLSNSDTAAIEDDTADFDSTTRNYASGDLEEDEYIYNGYLNVTEPSEVSAKAAAFKTGESLLEPVYSRGSSIRVK